MSRFLLAVVAVAAAALPLRRAAQDLYWRRHNRIWTDGWTSAWDCAEVHMRAYEDTPEKYVAEHGFWWRDEARSPA